MNRRPIISLIVIAVLLFEVAGFLSANSSSSLSLQSQDLESLQGYLDPAPDGMDVRYAWTLPGGHGENVSVVDIEVNWNLGHSDLVAAASNPIFVIRGNDPRPDININHGTAVLGELVAADDGVGVTGIANRARLGLVSPLLEGTVPRVADAINRAARDLQRGDVILVEAQSFVGPRLDPVTGRGLAPIEYENPVFEAIKAATARGIVVVVPAANGFDNLDEAAYGGAFNRSTRDSGAILVGSGIAGGRHDRERTEESNYGSRVDVQGWGRSIMTCGYGDLLRDQGENNWYTDQFGGTSGASAMVAGAAAILQSILKARGQSPLSPTDLRRLLILTGTPQSGNLEENIGPRPNLRAAIEYLDSNPRDREPQITRVKLKGASGRLLVDGESFLAGESVIELAGIPVVKHKYPSAYFLPNGVTTRILTKRDVTSQLPPGVDVEITVFNPTTGRRSMPFLFRRN